MIRVEVWSIIFTYVHRIYLQDLLLSFQFSNEILQNLVKYKTKVKFNDKCIYIVTDVLNPV